MTDKSRESWVEKFSGAYKGQPQTREYIESLYDPDVDPVALAGQLDGSAKRKDAEPKEEDPVEAGEPKATSRKAKR